MNTTSLHAAICQYFQHVFIDQHLGGTAESLHKADLHGTTLSHALSLRQVYDMNCFMYIKPTTRLRLLYTSKKTVVGFLNMF